MTDDENRAYWESWMKRSDECFSQYLTPDPAWGFRLGRWYLYWQAGRLHCTRAIIL